MGARAQRRGGGCCLIVKRGRSVGREERGKGRKCRGGGEGTGEERMKVRGGGWCGVGGGDGGGGRVGVRGGREDGGKG